MAGGAPGLPQLPPATPETPTPLHYYSVAFLFVFVEMGASSTTFGRDSEENLFLSEKRGGRIAFYFLGITIYNHYTITPLLNLGIPSHKVHQLATKLLPQALISLPLQIK
jgi:hypothetical protein